MTTAGSGWPPTRCWPTRAPTGRHLHRGDARPGPGAAGRVGGDRGDVQRVASYVTLQDEPGIGGGLPDDLAVVQDQHHRRGAVRLVPPTALPTRAPRTAKLGAGTVRRQRRAAQRVLGRQRVRRHVLGVAGRRRPVAHRSRWPLRGAARHCTWTGTRSASHAGAREIASHVQTHNYVGAGLPRRRLAGRAAVQPATTPPTPDVLRRRHQRRGLLDPGTLTAGRGPDPVRGRRPRPAALLTQLTRPSGSVYAQAQLRPADQPGHQRHRQQRRHLAARTRRRRTGPARSTRRRSSQAYPTATGG